MSTSAADWVLLNPHAYLDERRNSTTASATTSNNKAIEVSLCLAPPPLPSNLFVHCPELGPSGGSKVLPRVVRAAEDLLLLHVAVGPADGDYFIYRAHTNRGPSLKRLSRPHPLFHDDDVGLLSRGDHYTIAALIATPSSGDVYDLHLFHFETEEWSYRKAPVEEPQKGFPLRIPRNSHRLLYHDTTTVIAIGGEGGTMGWVDLWRGILLCDVLREKPTLRGVPLPLPIELVSCNNGQGAQLWLPKVPAGNLLHQGRRQRHGGLPQAYSFGS